MQKKFAFLTIWILLLFAANAKSQTTLRVNAGGPAYTDSQGTSGARTMASTPARRPVALRQRR